MRIEFKFGEVLPAGDPLARWIVKLGMIHNDLVFENIRALGADDDASIERFYWSRMAIAHYHEAMEHLEEEQETEEIAKFVAGLTEEARRYHDEALEIHKDVVEASSRVRNEATFHYPGDRSQKVLKKALDSLADQTGVISGGESNKVKDSRYEFADEVVGKLFYASMGGSDEELARIVVRVAEGERALMKFINHAMEEFFVQRVGLSQSK